MKYYITIILLLFSINSFAASSADSSRTANNLLSQCEVFVQWLNSGKGFLPDKKVALSAACSHTIRGFVDGVQSSDIIWRSSTKSNSGRNVNLPCIPGTVTTDQLVRVFVKFGEKHPKYLNQDYEILLMVSLARAFPYHANCYKQ